MILRRRLHFATVVFLALCFFVVLTAGPAEALAGTGQPAPPPAEPATQTEIIVTFEGSWEPAARAAVEQAASIWEGLIVSPVPIGIQANWDQVFSGAPAGAWTTRFVQGSELPRPEVWYPGALADAIQGSDDSDPYDVMLTFNSEVSSWYYGLDGNPPAGAYDMVTVALKYIGMGLGLDSGMRLCGTGATLGCWATQHPAYPRLYDVFAVNQAGQALVEMENQSVALYDALTGNNVYFAGAAASAANGGNWPKLYAPASWSAIRYPLLLDDSVFNGTANALMTHKLEAGEALHHPGPVALAMLKDMGWVLASEQPAAPVLAALPLQLLAVNMEGPTVRQRVIDLWEYTSDADTPLAQLTYEVLIFPEGMNPVTVEENRYLTVQVPAGWMGQEGTMVFVRDGQGGEDSQPMWVVVTEEIWQVFLPVVE